MFTQPETWTGGSLDLLVALGPANPSRRLSAVRAAWQWNALAGPYDRKDIEPEDQAIAEPDAERPLYGLATLPNGKACAFSTFMVEDDNGLWLYAGVPVGSLATAYPVGPFPFGPRDLNGWEREVHQWLFSLALHIRTAVSFDRGVIGWLTTVEVEELARSVVPESRSHAYIVERENGLQFLSPNMEMPLVA